jgi:hypothetical protein
MISIKSVPDRSDYQLLFQICIKDLAYVKDQQWKTVHLTLIGLGALLVAIREGIMQGAWAYALVILVTGIGLWFMVAHHAALVNYRKQKRLLIKDMPVIYNTIHPIAESETKIEKIKNMFKESKKNWDIVRFSCLFIAIIIAFAIFVFVYAIKDC